MVTPNRGTVYWFDFDPPDFTHTAAGRRPVLVVQSSALNVSRLPTVVVASFTTNLAAARAPTAVFVPAGVGGLPRDSVVKLTELMTVDDYLLLESLGELPPDLMNEVNCALRLVLEV